MDSFVTILPVKFNTVIKQCNDKLNKPRRFIIADNKDIPQTHSSRKNQSTCYGTRTLKSAPTSVPSPADFEFSRRHG